MVKFYRTEDKPYLMQLQKFDVGCWVDMVNPTDDEVEDVMTLTGIPEEMLKAALDAEETARVEVDDGNSMFLVDTPVMRDTEEGDSYETLPISVIFNDRCVVTVSLHGNPVLGDFVSGRVKTDTSKPVSFLLNFMLGNAKKFLSSLRQIDKKSLRVQAELHRSMKNKELIQLLELENSLVYFSTSLSGNMRVCTRMKRLKPIETDETYSDLYDDVLIEYNQAMEMCNIYRDILSGTMDAFASVISNNVNIVMKLLTVVTLIISIPTLIASLWGMNVNVPFADSPWGFWVVLAIAVVVSAVVAVVVLKATASIKIEENKTVRRTRGKRQSKN